MADTDATSAQVPPNIEELVQAVAAFKDTGTKALNSLGEAAEKLKGALGKGSGSDGTANGGKAGGEPNDYVKKIGNEFGSPEDKRKRELKELEDNKEAIVQYSGEDSYNKAKESIESQYDGTKELNKKLTDSLSGVGDAFVNALAKGENAFKALRTTALNAAADIAASMMKMAILNPLINSLFPSAGLPTLTGFGGARAGGGPVSAGSAYLVGERGPELFLPGTSGSIIPNHALQAPSYSSAASAGAGGGLQVVVNNNAPGVHTQAEERTGADGSRQLEIIVEQIADRAVTKRFNSGRADRDMQSNYGLSRSPIRRS